MTKDDMLNIIPILIGEYVKAEQSGNMVEHNRLFSLTNRLVKEFLSGDRDKEQLMNEVEYFIAFPTEERLKELVGKLQKLVFTLRDIESDLREDR